MCIESPKPPMRIKCASRTFNVANWMRIALVKKQHYALPSLQRCFKCPLQRFTSLPSASRRRAPARQNLNLLPIWFQPTSGGGLNAMCKQKRLHQTIHQTICLGMVGGRTLLPNTHNLVHVPHQCR